MVKLNFLLNVKFNVINNFNFRIGADDLGSSSDDSSDDSESENSKSSKASTDTDKVSPSKIIKSDDDGVSKEST